MTRVEDMDTSAIDAAVLALPPRESSDIVALLLGRDVHCFVEKPAGWGSADIAENQETAGQRGLHAQVGFNFRFTDAFRRLCEETTELRQRPSMVTIDFLSRHPSSAEWGRATTVEAWIRHNGVHALDMARYLLPAPIIEVTAHAVHQGPDQFLSTVWLEHADGALSVVRMGNRTERFVVAASVHGEDGTRITMPSLERVVCDYKAGTPSGIVLYRMSNLDHGWGRSGFGPELEAFLRHCRGEQDPDKPVPTLEDAVASAQLSERILQELERRTEMSTLGRSRGDVSGEWGARPDGEMGAEAGRAPARAPDG